jgi:FkbM family methyltransferase
MQGLKQFAKRVLSYTPYRVMGTAANRFDAMSRCLRNLERLGFTPTWIIDCGAHIGSFSCEASALFGTAKVELIDPQPSVRHPLEALARSRGFRFHPVGVSDSVGTADMITGDGPDTGAHLAWAHQQPVAGRTATTVQITTLDALFSAQLQPHDRALLKLDLQGHELKALRGGLDVLRHTEVAIVEVAFYLAGLPLAPQVIEFMGGQGFVLFDVAALSGRERDDRLRGGDLVFVRTGSPLLADLAWA